jgi:K+-transporting ATPase A subunit
MFERLGNAATYIYGLLLTASGHGQLQSIISDYTPQGRICSGCVPREQIVAPGVGIDLTTTYGYVFHPS